MTESQRAALRRLRGDRSLQTFADHLRVNGLQAKLSRQRLSQVEQGDAELPPALWHAIADALIHGGHNPAEVAAIRPALPAIDPPPETTPALRVRQWTRVVSRLAGNRWWQRPNSLMERVVGMDRAHSYRNLAQQHGIDMEWQRTETSRRLALTGPFTTLSGDAVRIDRNSTLNVVVTQVELFVLRAVLHNTGTVAWQDRLLYRIGPPVTSSLPFTPPLLPVPDTPPNSSCEIAIPGRAQWFPNLAIISYVMVYPNCAPCVPGRLRCTVDTRVSGQYDHTLPMPPESSAD
jgi:hypothetical protein